MSLMTKTNLIYKDYNWKAKDDKDNPKITGFPDNALLNRSEGYEVLDFINRFAAKHDLKQVASGQKVERFIHDHLPSNVRSHKNVHDWIVANWNVY
ncbi:hypothetical protein ABNQ39_36005 (plasmid) [Azospirillum sp. A26]|uniref:hypothetical protein n=1 Tax=Azospirillum sp. A26 TaxID=3160607 RepID=UPI00366FF82D